MAELFICWNELRLKLVFLFFLFFCTEKEVEVSSVEKRLRLEMSQLEQKNEVLRRELEKEEVLLERAKSGLDAAHQLNAQIEEKTRTILQLKAQGMKLFLPFVFAFGFVLYPPFCS